MLPKCQPTFDFFKHSCKNQSQHGLKDFNFRIRSPVMLHRNELFCSSQFTRSGLIRYVPFTTSGNMLQPLTGIHRLPYSIHRSLAKLVDSAQL